MQKPKNCPQLTRQPERRQIIVGEVQITRHEVREKSTWDLEHKFEQGMF